MIRAFDKSDLDKFERDDNPDSQLMGCVDTELSAQLYDKGITMTWINGNGEILGIGGVLPFWKGSGEAWMSVSKEGRKNPLKLLKDTQWFLDYLFKKEGFRRIQCSIDYSYPTAHRFILRCNFIPESTMFNYGPNGEHFVRYVRFS